MPRKKDEYFDFLPISEGNFVPVEYESQNEHFTEFESAVYQTKGCCLGVALD